MVFSRAGSIAMAYLAPPLRFAERTPAARLATSLVTAPTEAACALPFASRLALSASISAEPTTTPSADCAIARACSADLHAEADRDRQLGVALDAADRGRDRPGIGGRRRR